MMPLWAWMPSPMGVKRAKVSRLSFRLSTPARGWSEPTGLVHDRAVRSEGVQAALIAEFGHHVVDALDDFLGNGHLGLATEGKFIIMEPE